MALYKLNCKNNNLKKAEIVSAGQVNIKEEKIIEEWVENHSFCLGLGELLIISRQQSAKKENTTLFPDLLAVDEQGQLYVIELKKGKSPRDIIAQSLEYASWASKLEDDFLINLSSNYLDEDFEKVFMSKFEVDTFPGFKSKAVLVLVAEDISPRVLEVSEYLRKEHQFEIYPVEMRLYYSGDSYFIESKVIGFDDEVIVSNDSGRWSEDIDATEVAYQAVLEFTKSNPKVVFTVPDIIKIIHKKYPHYKINTLRCKIYANCPNHDSHKHYSGKHDYFVFTGDKGKFQIKSKSVKKSA